MTVTTVSPAPAVTEVPALDPALGVALGDEMLLGAASRERVSKVAGRTGSVGQSHTARAWTMGGQVD